MVRNPRTYETHRFTLVIPKSEYATLQKESALTKQSMTALIRQYIHLGLYVTKRKGDDNTTVIDGRFSVRQASK